MIAPGNLFKTKPLANEYDNPKQALAPTVAHVHTRKNPGIGPNN